MAKAKSFSHNPSNPNYIDYDVVDKGMLQFTDIVKNSNKFYAIELHKSKVKNEFRVFTEYGRTGVTGTQEDRFYNDEWSAKDDYDTIIREKQKKGYEPIDIAQAAKGSDKGKMISKIDVNTPAVIQSSKLQTDVQSLIRQIYDESGSKLSYMLNSSAIGASDASPLGTLTMTQIDKGYQKLKEIRAYINGNPNSDITQLSSEYFRTIPKKLPMKLSEYDTIYTIEKADHEEELLELLKDSLQVSKGLTMGATIDTQYDQIGADIELLLSTSSEWARIADKIRNTHDSGHNHRIKINRIFKVHTNTELRFEDKLNPIMELYHGSRSANIVGILKNSLRIRPAGAVTTGTMFGPGAYFADQVTKSTNYSLGNWGGSGNKYKNAFVFLVDVAVGKMKEEMGSKYWTGDTLPRGYDSVKGCKGHSLRNNEFIVYRPSQASLRYLVDFTPEFTSRW